jgi:peptidoglycan/LPS O-acetylase OafA/YrhL
MGIELFRGLAAFMVLLTHYAPFISSPPNGLAFLWTGVDMFFVISGFVFAPLLLGNGGDGDTKAAGLQTRAFFIRRFFRIYPLYLLAVLAYYLNLPEAAEKTTYFWRHLLFLHTTRSFEEANYFNPAFWSLPVEIEFYLLVPLLALLGGSRRWLGTVFVATLVLSLCANYLRSPGVDMWRLLSVHVPTILPEFLAGTLLYQQVKAGQARHLHWTSRPALLAMAGGCLLLGIGYLVKHGNLGLESNKLLDAPFNFLCACGYALVMYPLLLIRNTGYTPLAARIAKAAGASSYGVYLFHNLSPRLLQSVGLEARGFGFFLLAVLLTFVIAWVLYFLYENPLRNLGRRLGTV